MFFTPGVYIEELRAGARTIAGVSTSNTAFVGTFERGPLDTPVRVNSFGEFERTFGGLWAPSATSYAVRDFFLNGGGVAYVVRVHSDRTGANITASAGIPQQGGGGDAMTVSASSPGAWGAGLRVAFAHPNSGTAFSMLVREYVGGEIAAEEAFADLSTDAASRRYAESVINAGSALIRIAQTAGQLPTRTSVGGSAAAEAGDLAPAAIGEMTALTNGADSEAPADTAAWNGVALATLEGAENDSTGIYALDAIAPQIFNIMCIPEAAAMNSGSAARRGTMAAIYQAAYAYCAARDAFLIVDPPPDVTHTVAGSAANSIPTWMGALGSAAGPDSALYYPRITGSDPLDPLTPRVKAPSGAMAGIYAATDAALGVWKAPAGIDAQIAGGQPSTLVTDGQQAAINPIGVNVNRVFPVFGPVIWGARTLDGADARASEWKYVPVRRTANFIKASLKPGLQFAVFEPNDETLWANLRLSVGSFMNQLHRRGAFQGASARDAYLVKCDAETTTQADIDRGIVNILVAFAPLKPAEFVVVKIQQKTATAT